MIYTLDPGQEMDEEDFIDIEEREPRDGEYCKIKIVSYFNGWYMPECKSWSWLMDDAEPPASHVEAWKKEKQKDNEYYEYIPSEDNLH